MAKLSFIRGDATQPVSTALLGGSSNKIIVHLCNDVGRWGKGFVLAISKRWRQPEREFRAWHADGLAVLGEVQFVQVEDNLWIANMIGQHGIANNKARSKMKRANGDPPPIRYQAIEAGLAKVSTMAQELKASVHMPRIGCGLAGGKWELIEPIVERELVQLGVDVTVYDL